MTKITPEHLLRDAVVYVRQSTVFQVTKNLESQRRQYGLTERARQLGWPDVEVIDDDPVPLVAAGRVPAPGVLASRNLWLRSARAGSGRFYLWKPHGWRATAAIGTLSWSSVVWSAH
ncbi:MAG: hypothetical protein ACR2QF_18105 [Geminicoccaceae bacterium]